MKATKILTEEIGSLTVASLPSRPTAESTLGGRGYNAKEIKEAFDRLPLFIIERFNALIDDISALGENSLAASVPTGISEAATLSRFFEDVKSGRLATYIKVLDRSLTAEIGDIINRLNKLEGKI